MAPYTVSVRLAFLHSALAWGVEQGLLPKCPRFPAIKVEKKDPRPVPPETFERLLAKAEGDDRMQAFLLCGWLAGLRLEETVELEWEDNERFPWVDFGTDRIWLPAGFVKGKRDQWLPLDPVLREALEKLPRHGAKVFHFTDARQGRGGRVIQGQAVARRIVTLAKRAGVKLSMKVLRKGFGCYYAAREPAQVLQKLMRHKSIATTMGYYANVDDAVEEAVRKRQRNTLRNTTPESTCSPVPVDDASASEGMVNED